ncbi:MAG: glycine hydroxymethyltransferase [Chlamydiales bacterium]|nr:glycine hydroxymethyltransferase [Chlamydiia bacterium]MCP5507615.1 glycine hydroxymethyltransferase [Chlamydiales bacterium]
MPLLEKYLNKEDQKSRDSAAIAYLAALDHVGQAFPEIRNSIIQELRDQRSYLKLIASENYSSLAVQLAMGNLLTDKYAEGYSHHRFYAGCDNVDAVEDAAVQELKSLFGCQHAYVQPHSGADANIIAMLAVLFTRVQSPEVERLGKKSLDELTSEEHEQVRKLLLSQKLLGMSLNSGGHLTHGYRHNISSKLMQASGYEVDFATGVIDYEKLAKQVKEEKPLILLAGYSAHPRRLNFAKMREIADSVGAVLWVDMAHFAGLVAGKVFVGDEDPIPHAHIVTSTTHKTLRGPRGGVIMCTDEFAEMVNKGCPLVMGGPLPHVIAAKAIAFREANTPAFRNYAAQVVENANALAEQLQKRGIQVLTGGTENHMVLLNLTSLGITGRQAERALRDAHMTVNRNAIPNDPNGPWYTSGIRIGSPALTTLGMQEDEMREVADSIADVLTHTRPAVVEKTGQPSKANYSIDEVVLEKVIGRTSELLSSFPLYPEIVID